jgi:arsenate reductase
MTQAHRRPEIALDQQAALATAAARLARDFDGAFGAETIERFLLSSYDQFAGQATIVNFCRCWPSGSPASGCRPWPGSRAGRTTASRWCCSCAPTTPADRRMALGFLQHHGGDRAIAWSGGSEPGIEVNPAAVAAMAERGIDISGE